MISVFDHKYECCGCTACEHICPTDAIRMEADNEGFLYPVIDQELCIDCNRCRDVCPEINKVSLKYPLDSYALQMKEYDLTMSQSGGAFWVLATLVINNQGVVYGAGFDEELNVIHKRTTSFEEAGELRKSKYVQSDLNETFNQVKKDLNTGIIVLFSGTSCQCAGLINFVSKPYDNLITCDFICHGVPSPLLYTKYRDHLSKKYKSEIKQFDFRNTSLPWGSHKEKICFSNGKIILANRYAKLFYSKAFLRPCCHSCLYACLTRSADFTIADAWGAENYTEGFAITEGLSSLFVNTNKAEKLLGQILSMSEWQQIYLEDTRMYQRNLNKPTPPDKNRDLQMKILHKTNFPLTYYINRLLSYARALVNKIRKLFSK